jgi:hypothetical protein
VRDPDAVDPAIGFNLLVMHDNKQIDPRFRFDELVTPAGEAMLNEYRTKCYAEVVDIGVKAKMSVNTTFKRDPFTTAPFLRVYPALAFDALKVKGPLFLGIGGTDCRVGGRPETVVSRRV